MKQFKSYTWKDFTPKYWPLWLILGILRLLCLLPTPVLYAIGRFFGKVVYKFMPYRRRIVETNFDICFPDLTKQQRDELTLQCCESAGIGGIESVMAWWLPKKRFDKIKFDLQGLEHLEQAHNNGRGVIIVSGHFTLLEIIGRLGTRHCHISPVYRVHNSPVFEKIIHNARLKYCDALIPRDDVRSIFRTLRNNSAIWYAADQDFRGYLSVFAPFFGKQASTLAALPRLAKHNNSSVLFLSMRRIADGHYEAKFSPVIDSIPSGDAVADITVINQHIEKAVKVSPAQYIWLHRRFKTRPANEVNPYSNLKRSSLFRKHHNTETLTHKDSDPS